MNYSRQKLCPVSHGTGPCPLYGPVITGEFGEAEQIELEKAAQVHLYAKGDRILNDENAPKSALIVLRGCLVISQLKPDGGRTICRIAWPGDLIPFPFWGEGVETEIISADSCTICQIDLDKAAENSKLHQVVKAQLFDLTRNEIDVYRQRVMTLAGKTAAAQLASFLVELLDRNVEGDNRVKLPITRYDIGDYLGQNHATIARRFGSLKKDGIIALPTPWEVIIRDEDRLRAIAQGTG